MRANAMIRAYPLHKLKYVFVIMFVLLVALWANVIAFVEPNQNNNIEYLHLEHMIASIVMALLLSVIILSWEWKRRRRLVSLMAERNSFWQLLEYSGSMVLEIDSSGIVCLINNHAKRILRSEGQEIIGRPLWQLVSFSEGERAQRVLTHVLDGSWSTNICIELPTLTCEGKERIVVWHIKPLLDEQGRVYGALCAGRDVTDCRLSEETTKKLSRAVEQSPCIIMITDDDGYIEYVNPKFVEVTGLSPFDVIGMQASELGHQLHMDEPLLWEVLQNGNEWRGEFINLKKGGDIFFEKAFISPVHLGEKAGVKFIKVAEDVTERKVAEDQIKRLALIVEQAAEGIVVTDLDGTVTFANNAWARMHGYKSSNEIVGGALNLFHTEEQLNTQVIPLYEALALNDSKSGEVWHRHRDGSVFPTFMVTTRITDTSNRPIGAVGFAIDIAERKLMEEQIRQNAFYDSLTNLPNRSMFLDCLRTKFNQRKRGEDRCFALLFIDMDHFKKINDSYGHVFGDRLLVLISQRLLHCIRPNDMVSRLGGDEFGIILDCVSDETDILRVADRIHNDIQKPFTINQVEIFMTTSIGISFFNRDYQQPEEFLRDADIAVYQAKSLGRARSIVFEQNMHSKALESMRLENDLHRALERNEFILHYQPIIDVSSWNVMGFEALIRWRHPTFDMLEPMRFIPLAEETGIIVPIGDWVLRESCMQIARWREMFPSCHGLMVSVNISAKQFNTELPGRIGRILEETGVRSESLRLEITENTIMGDDDLSLAILDRLHEMGVKVYLDDFGTGYSSLNYIHKFPVDALKIDRSFVKNIRTDKEAEEIVKAIVGLGRSLDKKIIVEGIEDSDQLERFKELNCYYVQGLLFSKPLAAGCAENFIKFFLDDNLTELGLAGIQKS